MNAKQRAAVFERLKSSGKLKENSLKVPRVPGVTEPEDADKVNPDYVGKPRHQRFKKLKNIFGL